MSLFTKVWKYLGAVFTGKFDELADPKVQIDQAIAEYEKQHGILRENAANVIASQHKIERQLDRAITNLDKTRQSARKALVMAQEAEDTADGTRASKMKESAQNFAQRLVVLEGEVDHLQNMLLNAAQASDTAKAAVSQNAQRLQTKMSERQELLSQLGQVEMAEQMNKSMEALTTSVGSDVPSLDDVRDKIEGRIAQAQGRAELSSASVDNQMLEIEQAIASDEADQKLAELRAELGMVEIMDVKREER